MIALTATPVLAGSVVQGNFGRSPAYPTTPNGRFPQETAQIIEFKQRQVLQQKQGLDAAMAKKVAAGGIITSAAAFVGLGETNYDIAQRLGFVSAAATTAGALLCWTGYGCAIGGPLIGLGMVAGLGSASICLVADCSINVGGDGQMKGPEVRNVVSSEQPVSQQSYPFVNEAVWGDGAYNAHYTQFGVLREFVVKDSQGRYRRAFLMPYTPAGAGYPASMLRSAIGDYAYVSSAAGTPVFNGQRCENLSPVNVGCSTGFRWSAAGTASNCQGASACVLFYSAGSAYWSNPAGVVTKVYTPVQQLGYLDVGTGDALPPDAAAKPVSNQFMAGVANELWKRQASAAPVAWSPEVAITDADVQAYRQAYPERVSSLADLARPVNAPGQLPRIGPIDDPLSPPQQVEVTNPSAAPDGSSNPGQEPDPDTELDNDEGLLGDIMQPARDFLAGPFKTFMTPGISLPAGLQCPVISIDLPELLGRTDMSRPQNSQFVCDWMEQQRPLILGILHLFYALGAVLIVFRNS
jgi:hypothetical protein